MPLSNVDIVAVCSVRSLTWARHASMRTLSLVRDHPKHQYPAQSDGIPGSVAVRRQLLSDVGRPVSNWKLSGSDRSTSQIDRSRCSSLAGCDLIRVPADDRCTRTGADRKQRPPAETASWSGRSNARRAGGSARGVTTSDCLLTDDRSHNRTRESQRLSDAYT